MKKLLSACILVLLGSVVASGAEFWELCRNGSFEQVEQAIKAGADVNEVGYGGVPVLVRAMENQNPKVAVLLIEHGADVNVTWGKGLTPLMAVTMTYNPLAYTKMLVEAGADVNARNEAGQTVLETVIECGEVYYLAIDYLSRAGARLYSAQ